MKETERGQRARNRRKKKGGGKLDSIEREPEDERSRTPRRGEKLK